MAARVEEVVLVEEEGQQQRWQQAVVMAAKIMVTGGTGTCPGKSGSVKSGGDSYGNGDSGGGMTTTSDGRKCSSCNRSHGVSTSGDSWQ